jgi:hypothetical protein
MTRASTLRRLQNLRILVGAFQQRDIGLVGITALLGCSVAAARCYIHTLLARGVIVANPLPQAPGSVDKRVFRGSGDESLIHQYLSTLEENTARTLRKAAPAGERTIVLIDRRLVGSAAYSSSRRDPLVAALFGSLPANADNEMNKQQTQQVL